MDDHRGAYKMLSSEAIIVISQCVASSLLFALFALFHPHSHPRFPVPLSLQVPESACECMQLEVIPERAPFRESSRGGGSERGRSTIRLEDGPLTFWTCFECFRLSWRSWGLSRTLAVLFWILWGLPGALFGALGARFLSLFGVSVWSSRVFIIFGA